MENKEITLHFGALAETYIWKGDNPFPIPSAFEAFAEQMKAAIINIAKHSICISDMSDEVDPIFAPKVDFDTYLDREILILKSKQSHRESGIIAITGQQGVGKSKYNPNIK